MQNKYILALMCGTLASTTAALANEIPTTRISVATQTDKAESLDLYRISRHHRKLGWSALHQAAARNNLTGITTLLSRGYTLDEKTPFGETVLHLAAATGSLDVLRYLIAQHVPLDARNEVGETALIYATLRTTVLPQCLEAMKLLIAAGAGLDFKTHTLRGNNTALMLASQFTPYPVSGPNAVKMLIAAGAALNLRNAQGNTALILAAGQLAEGRSSQETLVLLLDAGAKPALLNERGQSAYDLCYRQCSPELRLRLQVKSVFNLIFDTIVNPETESSSYDDWAINP